MFKKSSFIILLLSFLTVINCAKRGTIDGGKKDTLAPVLKMSFPKNGSTDFVGNQIKLFFNEYIKIKNLNKQLIISPPLKSNPEIEPTTATKNLTIKIKDTLLPNTTYSFNFGQSIEDNNENNPYKQFKFVFSTGKFIDSLKLSGKIKDALNQNTDKFVSIFLYEINEKFNDSVVFKKSPRYVTNTLDSLTSFRFENLKSGKYMILALKDNNNNNKFDPKIDKIGFQKKYLILPNDTIFELELFKETPKTKILNPKQAAANRIILPFEGKFKHTKIELKNNNESIKTIITKIADKDSLQIWYKPIKTDSLTVFVDNQIFKIKNKDQKKDTLKFNFKQKSELNFKDDLFLNSALPLIKIDNSKITIRDKDSVLIKFDTKYDDFTQDLKILFIKQPLEKYTIKIFPGALTDYLDRVNDTITTKFFTKNMIDYGNLKLVLQNLNRFPVLVQLTDNAGKTIYSEATNDKLTINFDLIEPSKYTLRLIYDDNKNNEWDTGSYLEKRQAEEVLYFSKTIDIRPNWDVEQIWDCKLK